MLNMLVLLVTVCVLIHSSLQQCLTHSDSIRKLSDQSHESLLDSELQFSADLLHSVSRAKPGKNIFFSPSSIFNALLLAYFMSANQTENSLKKTLHLATDQDKLDIFAAYNSERYYQKLRQSKEKNNQLSNANRLYYAKGVKVRQCMKVLFGEDIFLANFEKNLKKVVKKINMWVADQTRNVIQDFLSEDSVHPDTELVLVNAAYFKGNWKNKFDPKDTMKKDFHLDDGSVAKVTMMIQQNEFKLREDTNLGAEVLELPYVGEDISMFLLLPLNHSSSAIQDLLKKVNHRSLREMVGSMASISADNIMVGIPKFTVEESLELTPILEEMGVGDLFKDSADLSTFSKTIDKGFTDAIHKAKIKVDEKGSEAAAATGFLYARMAVPSFIVDHPFVYIIYDKVSNIMLFCGVFSSPN